MGSNNSAALMLGVAKIPEGAEIMTEEDDDLLVGYAVHLGLSRYASDPRIPRSPYDAEIPVIGFFVAVGGSGTNGYPYLDPFDLADVDAAYGESLAKARDHWAAFATWAATKGIVFDEPRLYFTLTETA